MQNKFKFASVGAVLWIAAVTPLCAQNVVTYSLSASIQAGGGGASTNNVYTLIGTSGQPMTQLATSRPYQLQGGFWSGLAVVQTVGQPILRISVVGNNAVVIWPVTATGFVLEETADLASGVWKPSVGNIVDTATEHTFSVGTSGLIRIFRLRKSNPQQ